MAEPHADHARNGPSTAAGWPPGDELSQLRQLLIEPEQRELARMQARLDHLTDDVDAAEVAAVLPAAVLRSSGSNQQLSEAMLPIVEQDLSLSVKRHPDKLADLLFPVMGPAIRKAIRETMSSMLEAVTQTLDHALSPRGLRWRFEAARTGQSFSNIVFAHTLLYSVEQVFLIHRETGVMLLHVAAPQVRQRDPDMVSGMLTAIQDFVRDSFGQEARGEERLDSLQVGELTVWLAPGPFASVAGVIRGHPPRELKSVFFAAIEDIHRDQREALSAFAGDTSPFVLAEPHLEGCLQFQKKAGVDARPSRAPLFIVAALLAAAAAGGVWWMLRSQQQWQQYLDALNRQPGIAVTSAQHGWWRSDVNGLRDPLAADPATLLAASGLNPSAVRATWRPYVSLDPPITLARARSLLAPPSTVAISLAEDGTLVAEGIASGGWIADARLLARAMPGVSRFDDSRLIDERWTELQRLRASVESTNLLFPAGSAVPIGNQQQAIGGWRTDLARIAALARETNQVLTLEIIGHTDATGDPALNPALSTQRAAAVRALVASALPAGTRILVTGRGTTQPLRMETNPDDRAWNRRATVLVRFGEAAGDQSR